MTGSEGRFIPLEGCFNFRDLGGYRARDGRTVKSGRLFRSDALHHMTTQDMAYVQSSLEVSMVVDLRNPDEAEGAGRWPTVGSTVRYHNIPYLEGRDVSHPAADIDPAVRLTEIYTWIISNAGKRVAESVRALAGESSLPAVFHCTAGKDRTGVLSAIILGLLGVDDEQIMADYCLTNQIIGSLGPRLRQRPGNEDRPLTAFEAQPKAMERALSDLNGNWGGAEAYVLAQGVSPATVARMREALLE